MSDNRNDYGYPLQDMSGPYAGENVKAALGYTREAMRTLSPLLKLTPRHAPTKLERAQAIAAEVRARKFPPVVRITPKEST